ncbi:MAG: low molecular weight phosphotyrosine protein phosphatase [Nannocystaceae bacterium]|nr:low molecular weight phosphotyrosine protein phosphatase [Nannocystaceae bacterium]
MSAQPDIVGVLFVCHANLCRSPLCEGIFHKLVRERGLADRFDIDSAGCWAEPGSPPHPLSVEIAAQHGLDLCATVGRSRPIEPADLTRFDHIIAMDRANEADLQRLVRMARDPGKARIRLLRAIADPTASGPALDVPDPVRRGIEAYAATWTLLERACVALLHELAPG